VHSFAFDWDASFLLHSAKANSIDFALAEYIYKNQQSFNCLGKTSLCRNKNPTTFSISKGALLKKRGTA
jgi:hypothetical protein